MAAGAEHGIEPIGYRALESLRLEKGYRYFGAELTPRETPFEAGLDRFVRFDKGDFVGRDALARAPRRGARRPRASPAHRPHRRRRLGRRSTAARPCASMARSSAGSAAPRSATPSAERSATTYLPASVAEGTAIEVDVFADRIPGEVAADVLVDPTGSRMRT